MDKESPNTIEASSNPFFRYAGDAMFVIAPSYQIIEANDSACRLLDYSPEELRQMKIHDLFPPDELKSFAESAKLIGKEESLLHERKLTRKDGSVVHTEVNVRAVESVGYISIFRDITERKTTEAAFRESELKFKNLVEKSLVGVYIIQNGKFVYANPKFSQILGYTQEEILSLDNFRDIVDNEYVPPALIAWRKKLDAGIIDDFHIELKYRKKDGVIIWADVYCGETVYDGATALLGSMLDITERKKTEATILERDSLLTALFDNIEGSLALYNGDKRIVFFNSHFANNYKLLTNHEPKIGDGAHDLLSEEDRKEPSKLMDSALKGNKEVFEKDYNSHGKFSSFRTSFNPVINDGKVTGITSFTLDLTKRKEAEIKLKESEEKFRLSFMVSNDAFYIGTLKEGRIIDANNSFFELYGYTKEETIGKTIFDLNLYVDSEDRKRLVGELKANGHIKDFETNTRRKNGEIFIISMTVKLWEMNNETVIMAVIRDITERRKTEALIHEQAETFAAIIENANESIWLLSPDLKVLQFNKTARDRLTFTSGKDIYLGANFKEFLHIGTEDIFVSMFNDAVAGKYPELETEQTNVQGETFWLRTRMYPVYDTNKKLFGITVLTENITDRKKAEIELEQSEEKNRALIENISDTIILLNAEFQVTYQSPSFVRTAGFSLEEHQGQHVSQFIHPAEVDQCKDTLSKSSILPGIALPFQLRTIHKNGYYIWIEGTITNLLHNESVKAYVLNYRDITERKKVEEVLSRNNAELQKTNAELDRFVYSASHDLRAPLKSMLGLIGIINEDLDPSHEMQQECISMLNKSVIKLDNFIEDILHYSRNSRAKIEKDEIRFEELVQETRESHNFMGGPKKMNLMVEINQQEKFVSDKRRISVVLNNLVSNAIKYSDPSKDHSFIKIIVDCSPQNAVIAIEDNGIGIAQKDIGKIFEMFYRATVSSTGSGLGLYILKESLDKLDGKIDVESKLNEGTKFTVEIPNLHEIIN